MWIVKVLRDHGHGDTSVCVVAIRPTKELASMRAAELATSTGRCRVTPYGLQAQGDDDGVGYVDTYSVEFVADVG